MINISSEQKTKDSQEFTDSVEFNLHNSENISGKKLP